MSDAELVFLVIFLLIAFIGFRCESGHKPAAFQWSSR
jgi:hypothetical protein